MFAGGVFEWNPWDTAQLLNNMRLFREVFYLIVIGSVLALSKLFDLIAVRIIAEKAERTPTYQCYLAIFAMLFFIVALVIGFVGFMNIPVGGMISAVNLPKWVSTIVLILLVSFAVELSTAILDQPAPDGRF
jgi:hypothetical protein